jgi:hypothetical protein
MKTGGGPRHPTPVENAAPQAAEERTSDDDGEILHHKNTLASLTSVMRAAGLVEGKGAGPSMAWTPYGAAKSAGRGQLPAKSRIIILRPYIDAT